MGDDLGKRLIDLIQHERNNANKRNWYHRHRAQHMLLVKRRKAEIVEAIRQLKESTPCADCKKKYPHYVMDFDHIPGKKKNFEMAAGKWNQGWGKLLAEIAVCEIVCANCHRERTQKRILDASIPVDVAVGVLPPLLEHLSGDDIIQILPDPEQRRLF